MADEPENHTLALLCEVRADMTSRFNRLDEKLGRLTDDVRDLKVRQTATKEALAGVNRRLDRIEMRVERIEKRLDLVEA
jgi:archaellum component FlaC